MPGARRKGTKPENSVLSQLECSIREADKEIRRLEAAQATPALADLSAARCSQMMRAPRANSTQQRQRNFSDVANMETLRGDQHLREQAEDHLRDWLPFTDQEASSKAPAGLGLLRTQLWIELSHQTAFHRKSAYATGTCRNFRSHITSYMLFCLYFHLPPLPFDPLVICMFFEFLSRTVTAYGTLLNFKASLKRFALYNGYDVEPLSDFFVSLSLRALKKELSCLPKQKLPITPSILLKFARFLDFDKPVHAALWSCFLIAFFGFFRKSNLVPSSTVTFDPSKQVTRGSIRVFSHCLIVNVKWSKTIQFGERSLSLPICCIPGSILCPVAAYRKCASSFQQIARRMHSQFLPGPLAVLSLFLPGFSPVRCPNSSSLLASPLTAIQATVSAGEAALSHFIARFR
ncbi:uncharacterized protein [Ptychodera flava]|uniref:uncharacterized protein n=1 Tax=Ptychodera flava TaxID=63121 RepID=UPI00396A71A8